jgi:hypothetical protein
MNARTLQEADLGTPLEVLPPVLFNTFKHHAGSLRARIAALVEQGPAGLCDAARWSAVLGTKLMDLYTGQLSPRALSEHIITHLGSEGRLEIDTYRTWLAGCEEYAVVVLPHDESRWVLRGGDDMERYVHLHPGRWSPGTVRVRANVLKTAFLVLIHAGIHGVDALDREVINEVRRVHLALSPLGEDAAGEQGLGAMIELLRQPSVP